VTIVDRAPLRLPPRIALVALPIDLADYLREWIAQHWPEARVVVSNRGQRLVADLVVVDQAPGLAPSRPTLWLADIDRSQGLTRLGPTLWRTAMPTTPRRLRRVIETCLETLRDEPA
jgi:hypothetical protein